MKILLPVDGSALALDAVRFAIRMVLAGLRADAVLCKSRRICMSCWWRMIPI